MKIRRAAEHELLELWRYESICPAHFLFVGMLSIHGNLEKQREYFFEKGVS